MNKFDEDEFDKKLCNIITNIHIKQYEKKMEKKFNRWYEENIEHLEQLYNIAKEETYFEADFDVFCYYVFINSSI